MGYLIVLTAAFVVNLVVASAALGWISHSLFGRVHEWVLIAALFQALIAAALSAGAYERWEETRCS